MHEHELVISFDDGPNNTTTPILLVKVGASALKRSATFWPKQLVLAPGSIALDRVEAATVRFPALEDVSVNLFYAVRDSKGFTDDSRAPILARLSTFTFLTELNLAFNDITVLPDTIGNLTKLKYLNVRSNKIKTLPDTIRGLTALETLYIVNNNIEVFPNEIAKLKQLTKLDLKVNASKQSVEVQEWLKTLRPWKPDPTSCIQQ